MKYCFHPAAEAEHLETVAYYESKKPGLGATYLAEFENILAGICDAPQRYPIEIKPDIQRRRMKKFPFRILFRTNSDIYPDISSSSSQATSKILAGKALTGHKT